MKKELEQIGKQEKMPPSISSMKNMTKEEAKQLYLSEKNDAFNNGQKDFMGFYEWLNRKGIYEFKRL